jgi:hypothetical protein
MFVSNFLNKFYFSTQESHSPGEKLIKELSQHSLSRALIEEAQNVTKKEKLDPLRISFEATKSGFDAERFKSVISIKPGLSDAQKRACFLFELTNIIQHKKHEKVFKSCIKGIYKTADEYARAKEYIEFKGLRRRNFVSRAINKEKGFSYLENPWEDIPLENMEFDNYYNSYLSNNHKEYYRQNWRAIEKWRNQQIILS